MSQKPLYNDAWQASVLLRGKIPPSFSSFDGVTARMFPLKADLRQLQHFCQKYYNIGPSDVAQFRPVFPYIQLMIIHYAKMRPEGSREWISQNEIAFVIPLEWRREENGQSVFVDWVYATPFIFVDDDISLLFGREVYGWPKIAAKIEKELEPWVLHPRAPTQLMTVSTAGYFSPSARKPERLEKLLDITLDPAPLALQLRPDLNPLRSLLDGPQPLLDSLATMWSGFGDWAGGMSPGTSFLFDWPAQTRMMSTILQRVGASWGAVSREMLVDALFPGVSQKELAKNLGAKRSPVTAPPLNQMNVKQFRDAADPSRVCYQALVNSQIKLLSVENAGLLGDVNTLYGDPTGGFKLHLYSKVGSKNAQGVYENTGEMILRELGLEEAERREVQEGKEKVFVSTLKPFYPFWTQMELQYGGASTLCWRAHSDEWRPEAQEPQGRQRRERAAPSAPATRGAPRFKGVFARPLFRDDEVGAFHDGETGDSAPLKEYGGGAEASAAQPAQRRRGETAVLLNVYPLQADKTKLVEFCDKYFNNLDLSYNNLGRPQPPFAPLGDYVYFVALSTRARVKGWLLREAGFYAPVLWSTPEREKIAAVTAPFVYSESDIDAIVDRELNGRPTQDASLEFSRRGQEEFGLQDAAHPLPLFTVRTEVFPQGNSGEADKAGRLLRLAYVEGKERRNALDVDGIGAALKSSALKSLALKQFPDAEQLQYACYQALVAATWAMEGEVTVRKIEGERILQIYKYDYPKIAETLGLIPLEDPQVREDEPFFIFPVVDPFSVEIEKQAGWREQENIYWRAGSLEWQVGGEYEKEGRA